MREPEKEGMKEAAKSAGVPVTFNRCGSMFCAYFTGEPVHNLADAMKSDRERFKQFFHGMLDAGVYLAPSQFEAGFLSTAHSEADIEETVSAAVEGGLLISLSSLQAVRRTASTDAATPIAHRLVTGRLRDLWTPRGGSTKFEWTRSSVCKARTDQRSSTAPAYDVASSPHERASAIKPSRRSGDLCHAAAGYGSSVTLNDALVAPLTAGPLATSV